MRPFENSKGGIQPKGIRDGAYREQHGDRPPPTEAERRYTVAYLKAREQGRSIPEAIEAGNAAFESKP